MLSLSSSYRVLLKIFTSCKQGNEQAPVQSIQILLSCFRMSPEVRVVVTYSH